MDDQIQPVRNYVRRVLPLFSGYGDAEALVAPDGQRYTYSDLHARVISTATALWTHGIRPGAAIGILARNPPESIFLQLAAHLLGCRTAWIANNAPARFRRGFLELSEVDIFIYDVRTMPELGAELARIAAPRPVFCLGPDGLGPDLAAAPLARELPFDPAEVTQEPSSLFQTGGTTGSPKLVHHRQSFFQTLYELSEQYIASGAPLLRHLLINGTWHVSSQTAAFMTLFSGGTLFLHDGIEFESFLDTIERERINSAFLSPGFYYQLLDYPKLATADTSTLLTFTISGAATAPARVIEGIERFGPVLRLVYGMSESPFITAQANMTNDPAHPHRLASCGLPYADLKVEIRDAKGQPLPVGEIGEICVRGSMLMAGYWGMPELTAETLVDGWLRTGDAGRLDEDGYLYIVDRFKDMIVTGLGGTNVFCRPVEDALAGHPQVRQAAVIGVPDDTMGELVHAYVVRAPDATVTAEELRRLVAAELNAAWAPATIEFIDGLPLTESGKVDKKALRERHLSDARGNV